MDNKPINLSTAGITVQYAVEQTAGTRPTTGYKIIPGIKETADMNPTPEALESTTLAETDYKTYVEGLKDLGGALPFVANLTQALVDGWDEVMTAYETGILTKKQMWFTIVIPGLDKSVYFTGKPSNLGTPSASTNSVLETTLYITPTGEPNYYAKPTA